MLGGDGYDKMIDNWSVGILLYELLTGTTSSPFLLDIMTEGLGIASTSKAGAGGVTASDSEGGGDATSKSAD